MSHKVPTASASVHRQRQEAVWALEERVRQEAVWALEERVRQLQRDLGHSQAEARAHREQLSSFTELVKAAWHGECVAVAEVSRIVGVVPPLITVPAKERGQAHLRIQQPKVACNWAAVTERGEARELGAAAEGNGAARLSATEREQDLLNTKEELTVTDRLNTAVPLPPQMCPGIILATELEDDQDVRHRRGRRGKAAWRHPNSNDRGRQGCSRDPKMHQKDKQGVTSHTGPFLLEDQASLENSFSKRKNSFPDQNNYPRDNSTDRKNYPPNRRRDTQDRKYNSTDKKNYPPNSRNYAQGRRISTDSESSPQDRRNSPDRTNDTIDKKVKISQGLVKESKLKTSQVHNGMSVAMGVGEVERGIVGMWRTQSCPQAGRIGHGYLCHDHLDRKRAVFHREIMSPDDMFF